MTKDDKETPVKSHKPVWIVALSVASLLAVAFAAVGVRAPLGHAQAAVVRVPARYQITATLTNPRTGTRIILPVVVADKQQQVGSQVVHLTTYAVGVPRSVFGESASLPTGRGVADRVASCTGSGTSSPAFQRYVYESAPLNSSNSCEYDGSYAWQVCLTQYWDSYTLDGYYCVAVQSSGSYVATWTRYDSTIIACNATMAASVASSLDCTTNSPIYGHVTWNIGYPTPGTRYSHSPSWAGQYVYVNASVKYYQCGDTYTFFKRAGGNSYWTLLFEVCQGYYP